MKPTKIFIWKELKGDLNEKNNMERTLSLSKDLLCHLTTENLKIILRMREKLKTRKIFF